jgi:hypothetical protein
MRLSARLTRGRAETTATFAALARNSPETDVGDTPAVPIGEPRKMTVRRRHTLSRLQETLIIGALLLAGGVLQFVVLAAAS